MIGPTLIIVPSVSTCVDCGERFTDIGSAACHAYALDHHVNAGEPAIVCACGVVLSVNGWGWVRQGHRVSRRTDGTPIVGTPTRPDTKGSRIMCRPCCEAAVARET